jgi:hypothetical protein
MSAGPIRALVVSGSFAGEGDLWVLAVVDFDGVPAIIVTVFSTDRSPV